MKLFVTHCGINSMYEAIQTATPVVTIPIFADQFSNAARAEELGAGINLKSLTSLTQKRLFEAIEAVLRDPRCDPCFFSSSFSIRFYQLVSSPYSYAARMNELSGAFRNRPMSPQQSVVYWTEYVVQYNGTALLRPFASDMPFYRYFLLDVIGFVMFLFVCVVLALYFIVRAICTALTDQTRRAKVKKN